MPDTRSANAVRLEFAPGALVHANLSALTESVALPHGRGTNRAEALCKLPPGLAGGKPGWLVLYDAPGADRMDGPSTVFGDLLRHG